ncbi:hypothetical protein D9M71_346920 [compost metagenome]
MGIEQTAHQPQSLAATQRVEGKVERFRGIALQRLQHAKCHQRAYRALVALSGFVHVEQSSQALGRPRQVVLGDLPAGADLFGNDVDLAGGGLLPEWMARLDGFQPLDLAIGRFNLAELQVPVGLPADAMGQRPVETELGGVFLELLQMGEGLETVPGQPL